MEEKKELSEDRLKVLKRIEEYEIAGKFDIDVEEDPPTIPLKEGEVDFLRKKPISKMKAFVSNTLALSFFKKQQKLGNAVIKEIKGVEHFKELKDTGYIITCNHFNPFDTFAVESTFQKYKNAKKKLYKVIREGNYTNFPGFYGILMRNCNTLPLSENKHVLKEFMDAVKTILKNGDSILIFPEQSMWWNYRKPKPLKTGAFNLAYRSFVPILPIFITMEDTDKIGEDGFPIQAYTINVASPIYPEKELSKKENIEAMKTKNYKIWKEIYEDFYHTPLVYKKK